VDVSLFDYELPAELIAQEPAEPRDSARLMVVDRAGRSFDHRVFRDLPSYLRPADFLVVNETRVIRARLLGRKARTGGSAELLLLRPRSDDVWETLAKPGRRLSPGARIEFEGSELSAVIVERLPGGGRLVRFELPGGDSSRLRLELGRLGQVPLPPYIHRPLVNAERYQTVYAVDEASVAAPTAGLHFTRPLLERVTALGCDIVPVRLTVGLDTFRPVSEARVEDHVIHTEPFEVGEDSARRINERRENGGRVVSVGTTSARVLETVAGQDGSIRAAAGETSLFIYPGYRFKAVDVLLTNFHLPRSTLLMLVSAFAGRELTLAAYEEAKRLRYRFFSFGDAMLIL